MPRMPYSAREKIIKSLRVGPKKWSDLLKDTKLSRAALSTNIRDLIREFVITPDVDVSKRPPVTVYKIDPMASSFRTANPVYSIQEEEPEYEYSVYDLQLIGKRVLKDPKRLDQLLRLHIIKEICDNSSEAFAVISTDEDVELELFKLGKHPFESEETAKNVCIERIVRSVKHFLESGYGIKLPGHKIKEEIEKTRREGLFDIGLKHHYGIKVTEKLAKFYCDGWFDEMISFYDKVEKEIKEANSIKPG